MGTLLTIFLIFIVLAALASPIIFLQIRKLFREQKNFERGLKMVPLLIHLPPQSDDTEAGGRDAREVLDENISKAQVLYNIIASTLKKDFKSGFYGQRHFSLEIVGTNGFVYLYASVPIVLVEVVRQAIVSAYPSARVEETSEHNIFSPVGKISGTVGGELSLKEHFAFPIATYQELKRDAMQSLLNSLATLEKEDGVGIQILLRPAHPSWRKEVNDKADSKQKGSDKKKNPIEQIGWWTTQVFQAFVKPPDTSGSDSDKSSDISGLEQSVIDSMQEKTRYPAYETLIRVVASSNVSQRAQDILSNVVAAFALFDAQGKNGFTFTPTKDTEHFVTSYIMRFFPQEINKNVLNSVELASLFHFPDQKNIPTSQLERQSSKQVDGPRNMPAEGLLLGYNIFRGAKKPVRLSLGDRQRHMYVVGQTGTGKSTFLENLALQDMLNGEGFAYVDPHGDTAEKLLSMVPKERTEDIIYFCPSDMDYPMGLNLFEYNTEDQKDFIIQECLNMLYKLYDPQKQGIIGPRFERIFTNSALLLMADPNGGTFVDVPKLLIDQDFMKAKLKYMKDQNVLDFWTKEWPNAQRSNESGEVTSWVVSKFGAFLSNQMMRNIIGQVKSSFDMREIMDNKKILIVNLSKGRTGDLNSKLLGMIFVMKFQAAAMSRANVPEDQRQDFALYVDEFQNFSTDSLATIMSEARKYHLNLIVANQFTTQLSEEIRDAVFGNMGTIVSFRVGQNDVDSLTRYFQPLFDAEDLLRVPNYNTITRTLINGVPTQPFSMATLPPLGKPNSQLGDALKQLSDAKYGRPKTKVDAEINTRIASPKPARPTQPTGAGAPATTSDARAPVQPGQTGAKGPAAPGSGSFLDEWLAKRQQNTPPRAAGAGSRPFSKTQNPPAQPNQPGRPPVVSQAPVGAPTTTQAPHQSQSPPPGFAPAPTASQQSQALSFDKSSGNAVSYPSPSPQNAAAPAQQTSANMSEQGGGATEPDKEQKPKDTVEISGFRDDEEQEDTIYIDDQGTLHLRKHD